METILLVEDESLSRRAALRALRRAGFIVLEAENAAQAVARVSASAAPVVLFVIDVLLSGTSGAAVASELHLKDPATPVLYLYEDEADVLNTSPLETDNTHRLRRSLVGTQLGSRVRQILAQTLFRSFQSIRS